MKVNHKINFRDSIETAWVAGVVAATVNLVCGIFTSELFYYIDAVILCVLSFGVYARNKICSVAMLLFCIFGLLLNATGEVSRFGVFLFFILSWIEYQGMRGVFAYHKITKNEQEFEEEPNKQNSAANR